MRTILDRLDASQRDVRYFTRSPQGTHCGDIVYADGLTPVSDDGLQFTGDGKRPSIVDAFRRSISRVEELPCAVILAPHPEFVALAGKLARLKERPGRQPVHRGERVPRVCRDGEETPRTTRR